MIAKSDQPMRSATPSPATWHSAAISGESCSRLPYRSRNLRLLFSGLHEGRNGHVECASEARDLVPCRIAPPPLDTTEVCGVHVGIQRKRFDRSVLIPAQAADRPAEIGVRGHLQAHTADQALWRRRRKPDAHSDDTAGERGGAASTAKCRRRRVSGWCVGFAPARRRYACFVSDARASSKGGRTIPSRHSTTRQTTDSRSSPTRSAVRTLVLSAPESEADADPGG